MKLRPVFKCHGGKYYQSQFIISHFPANYTELNYGEGCGGAASVLLNKKPSIRECYNDIDWDVYAIFYSLAYCPEELINYIKDKDYTEETFKQAHRQGIILLDAEASTTEQGANELIIRRFSRGGLRKAFAWSDRLRGGQPGDVNAWETFKKLLPTLADRLKGVETSCIPITQFIKEREDNFLHYVDPPYLPETRKSPAAYPWEMNRKDHIDLAEVLNKTKAKVILSGYPSDLYMKLYKDWNLVTKAIVNHSSQAKKKEKKIECLWLNY